MSGEGVSQASAAAFGVHRGLGRARRKQNREEGRPRQHGARRREGEENVDGAAESGAHGFCGLSAGVRDGPKGVGPLPGVREKGLCLGEDLGARVFRHVRAGCVVFDLGSVSGFGTVSVRSGGDCAVASFGPDVG